MKDLMKGSQYGFKFLGVLFGILLMTPTQGCTPYDADTFWPVSVKVTGKTVGEIPAPAGFHRSPVRAHSFEEYLRNLPLLPEGSPILKHDQKLAPFQGGHARVVDMPVLSRTQQCSDSIIRVRSEFLWKENRKSEIQFRVKHGETHKWRSGPLSRYLRYVFGWAGTHHMSAQLGHLQDGEGVGSGDVLVRGGGPGHAVVVLETVFSAKGERRVLLGQGLIPAQQFHILRTPRSRYGAPDPWFNPRDLETAQGLQTLTYKPFFRRDVRIW